MRRVLSTYRALACVWMSTKLSLPNGSWEITCVSGDSRSVLYRNLNGGVPGVAIMGRPRSSSARIASRIDRGMESAQPRATVIAGQEQIPWPKSMGTDHFAWAMHSHLLDPEAAPWRPGTTRHSMVWDRQSGWVVHIRGQDAWPGPFRMGVSLSKTGKSGNDRARHDMRDDASGHPANVE